MALDFDKVNSYSRELKRTQPRDNTRINSKLEPRLKKKEEKEFPDNRTYLSQAPSKDIREANNLNHTLKQIQDFGDKLKQVGLDLRDYAAVGTSMLNPAAGMVLGLGDAGVSAAKGDYVSGGVQAGLEMLPRVGKGVKSVLSKKGKSTVADFIPQGNVNSYNNGINKDLEDFYNYLSDPKTIERLKFSDSELGTNYIQVIQKYLDVAKNSPNKKVFRFDENLIPDMLRTKTVGRGGASSGEFLTDPLNPDNYKMAVLNNRQPSTMGHEIKHILDLMEWTSRLSPEELAKIKGPIDVRASIKNSPRLKKLLEDNVVDYNTFKTRYKAKYPNAKEEEISKRYEYYNDPFEVNSQMHPIVQERIKTGRSGVFDYSDRASFEWDLNKAIINDGNDGALDVIYNMLIKDKQKFIDILNKYGYATVPTTIGGATMLNNKSK